MNLYETMFVLKPTLTPEETQAKIAFIKEVVTAQGGEIAACDEMGSKKLAYKVEKFDRGRTCRAGAQAFDQFQRRRLGRQKRLQAPDRDRMRNQRSGPKCMRKWGSGMK